ncbi:MAG: helix-turn-helix domain-containing protein [Cytophagales bacterium]|nr:helix-turn-helix domain-containing protein [Cytophagales bacterium]
MKIRQVNSEDKGSNPFGIVSHADLMKSDDLFVPTLRNFHVIFWFKKGTGTFFVDFQKYEFSENSLVLLAKDQISYFIPFDTEVELQSIVFTPEFIYRNDADLHHLFHISISSHINGIQIIHLEPEDAKYFQMLSDNMNQVMRSHKGLMRQNSFYHWLCLFLLNCERLQHNTHTKTTINDKLILQFNQLLEKHYKTQFKVDFYLREMNITVKSLSKLTREKLKLSPKAVIDERRVLEMKRQLKGTTKATKQIAYELGFDEPTNMNKYFKKHTGQTPSAFRKE